MKAIIMAGGRGTRLYPLTRFLPKPLMPVVDRPVLQYTLEHLKLSEIANVALSLSYQSGRILDFLDDGRWRDLCIDTFFETDPLGTAGGVKNSGGFIDGTTVVVSGDALAFPPLKEAEQYHRDKKSLCTILTVERDNPKEYGMVSSDDNGRVVGFKEKPGASAPGDRANTGIYILEPETLSLVPEGKPFDFSKDLFPLLIKENWPVYALPLTGYWRDIGNLGQYFAANRDMLGERERYIAKDAFVHPRADIGAGVIVGSGAIVGPQIELENAVLWPNTILWGKKRLKNVILAEGRMVHLPGARDL